MYILFLIIEKVCCSVSSWYAVGSIVSSIEREKRKKSKSSREKGKRTIKKGKKYSSVGGCMLVFELVSLIFREENRESE